MDIKILKLKCKRCAHEWAPRKPVVLLCPKCKSAYWDTDRLKKKGEKWKTAE